MALSNYVSLVISANTVGVTRAGFGTAMILSVNATFPERLRYYADVSEVAEDFAVTTSPEYLAASAIFAQSPCPSRIAIGRAVGQPTMVYAASLTTVTAGHTYKLTVAGQGVTETEIELAVPLTDVVVTSVANATETFTTVAHGMLTGDGPYRLTNSGGGLPAGTAVDTNYWIIKVTADTFMLAATYADAIAETELLITTDGTGTHTVRRTTNDVIVACLVDRLNSVVGNNYVAASTGASASQTLTVTGDAAGSWFSIESLEVAYIKIAMTHAEPATTLAADLAAITVETNDWYSLITLYNSNAYVKAAAAYIQTVKKIYLADVSESESVTLAVLGSDTLDDLKTLGYSRTAGLYHPSPRYMFSAAINGRCLPYDPGEETWALKTLSGVPAAPLTSTHRANLVAKNAWSYEAVTADQSCTFGGTTADGDYVDIRRGLDWLDDDLTKGVFGVLLSAPKISFTDAGIASVVAEVKASLTRATKRTIIVTGWTMTVPLAADVSTADKAARILRGIKFQATLDGAVHSTIINGSISV